MEQGFRVGDWLVQPQLNLISRGDAEVHLEHKAIEVLSYLAQHPGEVIPKERLMQAVWPDAFVVDHVLTNAISELRKALGDDPGRPEYIQTIPRQGYRLVAEVRKVEPNGEGSNGSSVSPRPKPRPLILWLTALSMLVALVFVMWFFWPGFDRDPAGPREPARVRPVTSDGVGKGNPQLSPNGQWVAYTMNRESNIDIYVQSLEAGSEPRRLTDHPAPDGQPVWSPDGTEIAFMRWNVGETGASLWTIPAPLGGLERKLADTPGPRFAILRDSVFLGFLSWSPDGIAKAEKYPEDRPSRIVLISPRTGDRKPLTEPRDGGNDCCPSFSPDGTRLAFFRGGELWVQNLRSGDAHAVTTNENYLEPSSTTWTPDGREIVFAASKSEWRYKQLFRVGAAGGTPQPVAGTGMGTEQPHLSGIRLVFKEIEWDAGDIWRIPGPNSDLKRKPEPVITTSPRYEDCEVDVSPDGKRIAFVSNRTGFSEIWIANADGTEPRQLTNYSALCKWPAWSRPDGRSIAFILQGSEPGNLYIVDVEGGTPRPLTSASSAEDTPSWSHDGRWIYLMSNRSGSHQIWKMPREGGEAIQLTRNGGVRPLESPDGRYVYYSDFVKGDGTGSIWRVPVEGGLEEEVLIKELWPPSWAVQGRRLYFAKSDPGGLSIYSFDLESREQTELLRQEGPLHSWSLNVSPDERWIFYLLINRARYKSDIMLVENFR